MWDDTTYPPRRVAGFYKKDELARLILRRTQRQALDVAEVKDAIVERYYQKRAIGSIFAHLAQARRKALLVMATGLLLAEGPASPDTLVFLALGLGNLLVVAAVFMAVSMIAVSCLAGWCFHRILKSPPPSKD